MEALKEYAGVITAVVSVVAALGALGLWAINVQVTPEVNRLEERIVLGRVLFSLRAVGRRQTFLQGAERGFVQPQRRLASGNRSTNFVECRQPRRPW